MRIMLLLPMSACATPRAQSHNFTLTPSSVGPGVCVAVVCAMITLLFLGIAWSYAKITWEKR